jgi:curved DNA-binding protein CbpA
LKNYYQILEVGQSASISEIKAAFRRLSFKYHPDLNHENDAEENFKNVNEAYQVLADPLLRSIYDEQTKKCPDKIYSVKNSVTYQKRKLLLKVYKNTAVVSAFVIITILVLGISSSISSVREINETKSNLSKKVSEYYKNNPKIIEREIEIISRRANSIVDMFRNIPVIHSYR